MGDAWAVTAALCSFDLLTTTSAWCAGSTFLGREVTEGSEWGPWGEESPQSKNLLAG